MSRLLEKILFAHGPMRSARLVAELVDNYGVSAAAARQRVSRARPPVMRFPIRLLPKKEAFLYLEDDRNTGRFWTALLRDLRESGSVYGLALDGLMARGGAAQRASFQVVSGAAVAQTRQVPLEGVVDNLEAARLIQCRDIGNLGDCIVLHPDAFDNLDANYLRARRLADSVLLDGLREWARRLGFASYDAIAIRDDKAAPRFSTFHWDLCGPSYLTPLVSVTNGERKPGFLVADVFADGSLSLHQVQYYLRKVRVLRSMKRLRPFLPILLAEGFDRDALLAGKSDGIVMATPKNLFGEDVARAMMTLLDTLARAGAVAAGNPEKIGELLSSLSAIEGAAGNLRGALFEMIVGFLVHDIEGYSIDIGEIVRDPKTSKSAEIDVRGIKGRRECWCYECRARQPEQRIGVGEVKRWLTRVDRIHRYHRAESRFQGFRFGFELWTTGRFDGDSIRLLEAEKTRRSRISLGWRDGPAVRAYAQQSRRPSVLNTLNEHYFEHPLAEADASFPLLEAP